jgi:hypothetical protein
MLKVSHCVDIRLTDGAEVVSLTHGSSSTCQKHFDIYLWYSFLLEAEQTPGANAAGMTRSIAQSHSPHRVSRPTSQIRASVLSLDIKFFRTEWYGVATAFHGNWSGDSGVGRADHRDWSHGIGFPTETGMWPEQLEIRKAVVTSDLD